MSDNMSKPNVAEPAAHSGLSGGLSQPWKKHITLADSKSLESGEGEVRLQLERDQHKSVGGPFCSTTGPRVDGPETT